MVIPVCLELRLKSFSRVGITSDMIPTLITEKRLVMPNTRTKSIGLLKHWGRGLTLTGGLWSGLNGELRRYPQQKEVRVRVLTTESMSSD